MEPETKIGTLDLPNGVRYEGPIRLNQKTGKWEVYDRATYDSEPIVAKYSSEELGFEIEVDFAGFFRDESYPFTVKKESKNALLLITDQENTPIKDRYFAALYKPMEGSILGQDPIVVFYGQFFRRECLQILEVEEDFIFYSLDVAYSQPDPKTRTVKIIRDTLHRQESEDYERKEEGVVTTGEGKEIKGIIRQRLSVTLL